MHKVDLPVDLREAAVLEGRRNRELQRQGRIFNAQVRTIGIDKQAIDAQVRDRKIEEETEAKKHAAYAGDMVRYEKIASLLEERQKQDTRNLNRAIDEFRQCFQKPETCREFDLNDPQALKKDVPARVSDDDPRCTVASLQKFLGEDLSCEERLKLQQEQLREWSLQQQQELEKARADQKFSENLYDQKRIELDRRAMELQKIEEDTRRAICAATKDFNMAQVSEAEVRKKIEKQHEEEDNMTEIFNLINGDLLSENPEQGASAFGPNRVVADRWKGMSVEQIKEIKQIQLEQAQEKKRLKEEEKQRDAEWDHHRVQTARSAILLERQQERLKRQFRKTLDAANTQLAQEHKAEQKHLQRVVYSNVPTAQYFEQFNTASR